MPTRSLFLATPWVFIGMLTALSLVILRYLRGITFRLGQSATDPFVVTANEVVCILYVVCVVALVSPSLPDVDLRRRRAQWLAVSRFAIATLGALAVSSFASYQIKNAYMLEANTSTAVPETGLVVHNSLLILGIAGVAITLFGKLRGVPFALAAWIAGTSPLFFLPPTSFLWPLDTLQDEGPWLSWPHVVASSAAVVLALITQFRTAGASARALRADR